MAPSSPEQPAGDAESSSPPGRGVRSETRRETRSEVRVEICVESVAGVRAARSGGAHRVELCSALALGGLTPSGGALRAACSVGIDVVSLVRPRAGDFVYDVEELEVMARDVELAGEAGAFGVALGVLRPDGSIDVDATAGLVERARPLAVTFHRAFDVVAAPRAALEELAGLGVDRVLTSGQAPDVERGMGRLAELVQAAGDRLIVLPGCGVRAHNVARLLAATGAREVHASAGVREDGPMEYRSPTVRMGSSEMPGEYERSRTDAGRVAALVRAATLPPSERP